MPKPRRRTDPNAPPRVSALMAKQAETLFPDPAERQAFVDALLAGESRDKALVVLDPRPEIGAFPKERPLPWQPEFVVRVTDDFRPGRHALHAKGAFYVLDFSSAFAASAMLALPEAPKRVLDLCASPGGKAVFAWRAFQPEELVANETIRKRTSTLIGNLERCGVRAARVGSADPSVWAKRALEGFDLVLVDAPCSGQSLLAKGEEAEGCWHPQMIDMNVSRQRRITGNAYRCLRPGAHMLYMTCTFSRKENEKVIEWLLKEYEDLEAVEVPHLAEFRSRYADFPCYRLFPQSGLGAGAFTCLLRRKGEAPAHYAPLDEIPTFWRFGDPPRRPREEGEEPARPVPFEEPASPRPRRPAAGAKPGGRKGRPMPPPRKPKPSGRRGRHRPG